PPLDVEHAVGGAAGDRCIDATAGRTLEGLHVQVVPVGHDGVVEERGRQTGVGEHDVAAHELQIAVGADVDRVIRLPVEVEREGERDRQHAVVTLRAGEQSGARVYRGGGGGVAVASRAGGGSACGGGGPGGHGRVGRACGAG